ncbi:MAG: sugar ABC transporter permease [Actinobacteria bacterium]|nr:sugar ABC transporter permease [Actinomycetota bacterium]
MTFQGGSMFGSKTPVGLENYRNLIKDPLFPTAIVNTLKYLLMIIPMVFLPSMVMALSLNSVKKFRAFFRTSLFFPLLCSMVVAAIIWRFLVYPDLGPISRIFDFFHVTTPNWFGNPKFVLLIIAMVELWRGMPFYVVTFLAGLQGVSRDLYEASYIDGANAVQTFFHVTLPSIKPVLTFALVMATIWALQLFDSVYVLTRGGPADASTTIAWYIYKNTFFFNKPGKGAAMSLILLLLTGLLTWINLKITKFHQQSL